MQWMSFCCFFFLSWSLGGGISGTNETVEGVEEIEIDYEELLVQKLLQKYDPSVRPGRIRNGVKEQLNITAIVDIRRILESDDRLETMSMVILLTEVWSDHRLVWDPKEYGNISKISIDNEKVWTPRSFLPNLSSMNREDISDQSKVFIHPSLDERGNWKANVLLATYAIVQERCAFDMTYFPFDHQTCNLCNFNSQYTDKGGIDMSYSKISLLPSFDATFVKGGEWDLVDASPLHPPQYTLPHVCFSVVVQRRSLYYVINMFLPTVTICVLNTIGLFAAIHTDSEELDFSSLGQTTLLSLAVVLLTVADQTPRGSSQVSILGIFFLAMICQTLLAALTAVCLKKHIRNTSATSKELMIAWPRQPIVDIKTGDGRHEFIRKHGPKMFMILHLILISLITGVVFALGASNVLPSYEPHRAEGASELGMY